MPRLIGLFFILAGVNHFVNESFYVAIVPPYIPWPALVVALSGVAEIVLGGAFLFAVGRRWAAWGLIALLVALFPANVHMALHPEAFPGFSRSLLWIRLPLQAVLIAMIWPFARMRKG